ncbi:hypothetical protein PI125_g25057 [Phytophthora idaei]|nr:hypothetical protein PI125_g25057 [Phytophthora idaei]
MEFSNEMDDVPYAFWNGNASEIKELEEYVRKGMRDEDEVDSLDMKGKRAPSSTRLKWQDSLLKAINRVVDIAIGDQSTTTTPQPSSSAPRPEEEDTLIDRIGKIHQLFHQVKERQRKANLERHVVSALAKRLALYQQRLDHYENRLAALD